MVNDRSVSKFHNCYGCGICAISCPHNAITLQVKKGFYLPFVDASACTNCGSCLKYCAYENYTSPRQAIISGSYSVWSKDPVIRKNSTSGGIIYEICKNAIGQGFKILGVRYDYKKNIAKYFIIQNIEDLSLSTGSKYLQSYTLDALQNISSIEKYIVVGLPCMIASLRSYIKGKRIESNFVLIDFFCHGVPSYTFYWKYYKYLCGKIGTISSIKFRSKREGWQNSTAVEAVGSKGEYFNMMSKGDLFFNFFLGNRCLNDACYDGCCFKGNSSLADIRVGDFWGKKYSKNELGINSVLSFTPVGDCILDSVRHSCIFNDVFHKDVLRGQMKSNAKRSPSYRIVQFLLAHNCPLIIIGKIADVIDGIVSLPRKYVYYKKRLAYKYHIKG